MAHHCLPPLTSLTGSASYLGPCTCRCRRSHHHHALGLILRSTAAEPHSKQALLQCLTLWGQTAATDSATPVRFQQAPTLAVTVSSASRCLSFTRVVHRLPAIRETMHCFKKFSARPILQPTNEAASGGYVPGRMPGVYKKSGSASFVLQIPQP